MSDDPTPSGFMAHDSEYEPGIPNVRKRAPERKGKPRAAQEQDVKARMSQIIDDIIARDGPNLRYRGRGR